MHIIGGHAEATDDPTDLAIESVKLGKVRLISHASQVRDTP